MENWFDICDKRNGHIRGEIQQILLQGNTYGLRIEAHIVANPLKTKQSTRWIPLIARGAFYSKITVPRNIMGWYHRLDEKNKELIDEQARILSNDEIWVNHLRSVLQRENKSRGKNWRQPRNNSQQQNWRKPRNNSQQQNWRSPSIQHNDHKQNQGYITCRVCTLSNELNTQRCKACNANLFI